MSTLNVNSTIVTAEAGSYHNHIIEVVGESLIMDKHLEAIRHAYTQLQHSHFSNILQLDDLFQRVTGIRAETETAVTQIKKRLDEANADIKKAKSKLAKAKDAIQDAPPSRGGIPENSPLKIRKRNAEEAVEDARCKRDGVQLVLDRKTHELNRYIRLEERIQAERAVTVSQTQTAGSLLDEISKVDATSFAFAGATIRGTLLGERVLEFATSVRTGDKNAAGRLLQILPTTEWLNSSEANALRFLAASTDPKIVALRDKLKTDGDNYALSTYLQSNPAAAAVDQAAFDLQSNFVPSKRQTIEIQPDLYKSPIEIQMNYDSEMARINAEKWEDYYTISKWAGAGAVAAPIVAAGASIAFPAIGGYTGVTGATATVTAGTAGTATAGELGTGVAGAIGTGSTTTAGAGATSTAGVLGTGATGAGTTAAGAGTTAAGAGTTAAGAGTTATGTTTLIQGSQAWIKAQEAYQAALEALRAAPKGSAEWKAAKEALFAARRLLGF